MSVDGRKSGFNGRRSVVAGGAGRTTVSRLALEDETQKLHGKTFKAWINGQLKPVGIRVIDLKKDLQDGLILIALIEVLSGNKCKAKYHLECKNQIQKIENCAIAIDFIKENCMNVNINAKDIADGNIKIILGLLWRIILQYQLIHAKRAAGGTVNPGDENKSIAQRTTDAKEQLLQWVKAKTAGYSGVNVTNFDTSFHDGLAFCALIHKYDPTLLDYNSLDKNDVLGNLEKAFQIAEEHLGIHQLIDAADMVNPDPALRPDEQCIMTYVSEFPRAFLAQLEAKAAAAMGVPGGVGHGEGTKQGVAAFDRKSRVRQSVVGTRDGDGIVISEITSGVPVGKPQFSVAEVFNPEISAAQLIQVPQIGTLDSLDGNLPSNWELQKAMTDAELQRLMEEKMRLENELSRLRSRMIGQLTVGVIEARGLMALDLNGRSDPYAMLTVERQREKTKKIRANLNPKWDAGFKFYVSEPDAILQIVLYDWDRFLPDGFLGKLLIPISELPDGKQFERWYTLLPKKPGKKISGEINLRILYQKEK